MLPLVEIVEIDLIDLVDHLPHQLAGFHVVVGVLEHVAHHAAAVAGLAGELQVLQRREQFTVDEVEQAPRPVMPSGSAAQLRHWNFSGIGER